MITRSFSCHRAAAPVALCLGLVTTGCLEDQPPANASPAAVTSEPSVPDGTLGTLGADCSQSAQVVTLQTEDALTLEADLYTTGVSEGPVALLLHMVPPFNTRANYKQPFIDRLLAAGVSVLNLDRRGAGNSQGNAVEAYTGPNGKLDAQAAVTFLGDHACSFDLTRLALIGASNGSTTALDFTIESTAGDAFPEPSSLVFLTGGSYTEAQNQISTQRAALDPVPVLFVYSTVERAWSVGFEAAGAPAWQFAEFAPGAHGTAMFDANPEAMDRVADFVTSSF